METITKVFTPFRRANTKELDGGIDNLIEDDLSLSDENNSYEGMDFGLGKVINGTIRENNPINLITNNIIKTYKCCNPNFVFEDDMKPRRELTEPSLGKEN